MKKIHVKARLTEDILGTLPCNEDIARDYVAGKAPDAKTTEEEIAAIGVDEFVEKGKTVFPKEDGKPFVYDYQVKGFYKGAAQALNKIPGMKTASLKAYKKKIDINVFVYPRKIFFKDVKGIYECQRPLRAQTMQGERVSLAISEMIPAGATFEFDTVVMDDSYVPMVEEWLTYSKFSGLGQWRNSGKGRFEILETEISDCNFTDDF